MKAPCIEKPIAMRYAATPAEAVTGVGATNAVSSLIRASRLQRLLAFVLACMVALAFYPTLSSFWQSWTAAESPYGFGYFVPLSVAYLLYANRNSILAVPTTVPPFWCWTGLFLCACLQTLGVLASINVFQSASLALTIFLLPAVLWGAPKLKAISGYLAYGLTMIPLPGELVNGLLVNLQNLSIAHSYSAFKALGLPANISGQAITLPHFSFDVAPACAGLSTLFPTVSCAIVTAMMLEGALSRKLFYVAISIPVSIAVNSLRIIFIGLMGEKFGAGCALKIHDASGVISVVAAISLLSLVGRFIGLKRYQPQYRSEVGVAAEAER